MSLTGEGGIVEVVRGVRWRGVRVGWVAGVVRVKWGGRGVGVG